jgi:hypothetical protein
MPTKSLLGLPWRYALACMDDLGLILRAEIIWAKPNGLPESVTDRVRRSHEQVFHFTRQPRYYAAVDEIREPYPPATLKRYQSDYLHGGLKIKTDHAPDWVDDRVAPTRKVEANPLGKLPGSVWDIPSQPLTVPAHLGVDHFAAFPFELPRRVILGWSPPGVCTACGQGRRPVADRERIDIRPGYAKTHNGTALGIPQSGGTKWKTAGRTDVTITGYACACGAEEVMPGGPDESYDHGTRVTWAGASSRLPPTRPSVVVDPFGGTGTTALVASVLGRDGFSFDLSADYCRLAAWRCTDPGERARAMQVPKPPPVVDGQEALFSL